MNTANLQLEGLYLAFAAILEAMCEKGLFEREELMGLLAEAESALAEDQNRPAEMRDANVDAICFPVRFLRQALRVPSEGRSLSFAQLASQVGQAKRET
ncbi:MAG: hypothetical protein ACR650_11340 [Methylocystis sp.]|jgi:hypothetical protein